MIYSNCHWWWWRCCYWYCCCAWRLTVPVSVQVAYCYQNVSNWLINLCCWHFCFLYWFGFYWVSHCYHNMFLSIWKHGEHLRRRLAQIHVHIHAHNRWMHHHLCRMNRLIDFRHLKSYLNYRNVFAVGVIFSTAHSLDIQIMNSVWHSNKRNSMCRNEKKTKKKIINLIKVQINHIHGTKSNKKCATKKAVATAITQSSKKIINEEKKNSYIPVHIIHFTSLQYLSIWNNYFTVVTIFFSELFFGWCSQCTRHLGPKLKLIAFDRHLLSLSNLFIFRKRNEIIENGNGCGGRLMAKH